MKNSETIATRIETLKAREEKLKRALENMHDRVFTAERLYRQALEKELPTVNVKHIESLAQKASWGHGYDWIVKFEHNGRALQYMTSNTPVVKNGVVDKGNIEVTTELEVIVHRYPSIKGGKIKIKEYFLQQINETQDQKEKELLNPKKKTWDGTTDSGSIYFRLRGEGLSHKDAVDEIETGIAKRRPTPIGCPKCGSIISGKKCSCGFETGEI